MPEGATSFPNPASAFRAGGFRPPELPTYLLQSILATVLCCVPFGIVAIVNAAQVKPKLEAGDYPGARHCSARARTWSVVALVAGLLLIPIGLVARTGISR